KIDELRDLAVRITSDVDQSRAANWLFVQAMNRNDWEEMLNRPMVRHRLENREVAEVLICQVLVQRFNFVWNILKAGRVLMDHFADLPEDVLHLRAIFE